MEKTLFSANAFTGAIKYAYLNPDNEDQFIIETHHTPQVYDLLAENAELRKMDDGKWGDWALAARVPMTVYFELVASGKIYDAAYMKKWLNNPDNRMFRTKNGEV